MAKGGECGCFWPAVPATIFIRWCATSCCIQGDCGGSCNDGSWLPAGEGGRDGHGAARLQRQEEVQLQQWLTEGEKENDLVTERIIEQSESHHGRCTMFFRSFVSADQEFRKKYVAPGLA